MFFDRERAVGALPELGDLERAAIEALLPGPLTLLLPNRDRRFPSHPGRRPTLATPWACVSRCSEVRWRRLPRCPGP